MLITSFYSHVMCPRRCGAEPEVSIVDPLTLVYDCECDFTRYLKVCCVCFPQEVLRWIQDVVADIGSEVTLDQLKDYIHKTLKSGRVL